LSRAQWVVAALGGVVAAAGVGYVLLVSAFDLTGECGELGINSAMSPDGAIVASIYQRNCGATTDIVTHVNLRRRTEPVRADLGVIDEGQVLTLNGRREVKLRWAERRRLVIEHEGAESFHPADQWNDVTIEARRIEPQR
jgi:hypothetical protein